MPATVISFTCGEQSAAYKTVRRHWCRVYIAATTQLLGILVFTSWQLCSSESFVFYICYLFVNKCCWLLHTSFQLRSEWCMCVVWSVCVCVCVVWCDSAVQSSQWFTWGPIQMQCRLCAACWTYWKKYGGLKMPTRLGLCAISNAYCLLVTVWSGFVIRWLVESTAMQQCSEPLVALAWWLRIRCPLPAVWWF